MLDVIHRLQTQAEDIFGYGYARGESLGRIRLVIVRNFERLGVEPPEDVFAFTTGGLMCDSDVKDWRSRLAA
jgi:hypothetical protein